MQDLKSRLHYPINYPSVMNSTFSYKIIIKKDQPKKDGTCPLYAQFFINKVRKRLNLGITVRLKDYDPVNQRVKRGDKNHHATNLLLGKFKADVNKIRIDYKLSERVLTMDSFMEDLRNPNLRTCFIVFYEQQLNKQKSTGVIAISTYKQQLATLKKLKEFKKVIYFNEVNQDFIEEFTAFLKIKKKNGQNTIFTALKNVKKYVGLANRKNIATPILHSEIVVRSISGNRNFLEKEEINKYYKYYCSEFINDSHKKTLAKFLFCISTGLRISDVQTITSDNFIANYLVLNMKKNEKLLKLPLNKSAFKFVNLENNKPFDDDFEDQTLNKYLREITSFLQITKKVSFHVARHTFASQFLIQGGKVEVLRKLLGHTKIETTMIYVHILEDSKRTQIENLDILFNLN